MDRISGEVTNLLIDLRNGNKQAESKLIPLIYGELRKLARHYMRGERTGHSLQATALVHEAYLRLTRIERVDWQSRSHFFAVAAQLMRRILVDHARAHRARKRGGSQIAISFEDAMIGTISEGEMVIELDEALSHLARLDPRQSQIVELRFFAGLSEEETGVFLGISTRTVKRDWRIARAWLFQKLSYGDHKSLGYRNK
jgi:RNA polymerase sigma-70 factor (ECF subfamily)